MGLNFVIPYRMDILAGAYEDTGAPNPAGVIPEPSSLALAGLGLLALGYAGVRQRRKKASESAGPPA